MKRGPQLCSFEEMVIHAWVHMSILESPTLLYTTPYLCSVSKVFVGLSKLNFRRIHFSLFVVGALEGRGRHLFMSLQ